MDVSPADITDAMRDHPFFGGASTEERERLIDLGQARTAASGTILFQRGDAYRGFYLLVEGGVHVYRLSPEGRMLVLHVIRPGESFAEVPLFETDAGDTYPATAETLTDSALLFFPADAFLSFVDAHPRSALHMLGQMAGRLRSAVRQLDAVSLQDVTERLARYLVEQVPTVPDNPPTVPTVELDIPKSVLAAELGTVPETLSRALRTLQDKDLIRTEDADIVLTDVRGLRHLVDSA
ncbi:CRP/FNR family transcriptional regulator [Salinibacter ruber]|uniref:CRP/FNR family transcriptional regulator n=1 Tax=Salinibacter ruber TaxID=146919 RepID=A0A9X2UA16_9BACT|nr:Crp/Fnr family transcriptional regulator [Salinibacter ruber]MCS3630823.1 CRP/FNR family transcriptional regulator [Salinibacter ruber]MCS3643011.1 CRP/FNR family transcriptional regulator [Salinibacter ruber]MCS3655256.1 CRP/FNR family transcriptional regulator [Salinibacter ruber]MCS3830265.1 CRP/FNR family transcriptional regulator [Salinibacter ruber]MCS3952644.1 CRP/FNR family transcriptional regulator [Salinibacter ruber]